jgi:hypothetical protein
MGLRIKFLFTNNVNRTVNTAGNDVGRGFPMADVSGHKDQTLAPRDRFQVFAPIDINPETLRRVQVQVPLSVAPCERVHGPEDSPLALPEPAGAKHRLKVASDGSTDATECEKEANGERIHYERQHGIRCPSGGPVAASVPDDTRHMPRTQEPAAPAKVRRVRMHGRLGRTHADDPASITMD